MINLDDLKKQFHNLDFREKRTGLYKILIPFYYEDGDMYDLFIEESPKNSSLIRLSDYGLTLMKLSYDFDMQTENKKQLLENLVIKNRCSIDDGNIYIDILPSQFEGAMYQMIQTLSKISTMDIINRETIKTYFYEDLDNFITQNLKNFSIEKNARLIQGDDLTADYKIQASKPIYLFGVNDNTKASKVIISCLTIQSKNIPHRSLIVHHDIDNLSTFNQKRITNVVDKQFTSLPDFQSEGVKYLERESA